MATKKQISKTRRESSTDLQERAALLTALQEHIQQLPGTQAEKARVLDITQPRLNDLLKERIDKFSLDSLVTLAAKAGLRVNMNVQPVKIYSSLGTISQNIGPALSVFAPSPNELSKVDSKLGTGIFLSLLRCEALRNGLSPKDVVLSMNVNIKDGGIDAKIENSETSSGLLKQGSTHFQIKTGESFEPWTPSKLKKELFGKSNAEPSRRNLGDAVKNCLDQDGTYVLVTFGHDLLPLQHSNAILELKKIFEACGYKNPKVEVYGQGQLVGELDKYPSICLDLIGLNDGGFLSINGWKNNSQMQYSLKLGDKQKTFIKEIQTILYEGSFQHIRVIGEPGIGKTRLILDAVSVDNISPSVIYVPTGEDFQKSKLFNELLKPDRHYTVTLVIDDCDNNDRASIWSALKGHSGVKLITIDHGPDNSHDSSMKTMECPKLDKEQIEDILFGYLQNKVDLHNWASWCSGSPRVAHAVGENLRSNPGDILKSPADVPIWDRFIIGHKEMDSREAEQYRIVLRHVALFHRFGFEPPVSDEAKFIHSHIKEVDPTITWGRFQAIVQFYRNKRILQGRHTLFIVPKALHIHLWIEFWLNHGPGGFDFHSFLSQVPNSMRRWFLQLFIYAHAAEPAQKVVREVLSPNGPFSNPEFLESDVGLRFLNYLAEADPSATLGLLERTVKKWPHGKLYGWEFGRQEIVWALEKIAAWDHLFVRAADILIRMALAENAKNSNNSEGLLRSLFNIGLGWAPTEASPSKRFPILERLVRSPDASERTLGLELCREWLNTYGGSRIVGAEYQGLKPPIEFWRPKTYGEVFDYWRQVLRLLRNEIKGFNDSDLDKAVDVIVSSAKGLMDIKNMSDEIIEILFELAENKRVNRKPITQFVIWELRQREEKLGKDTRAKILKLDKLLTGETLWERINRYVLHTNWDEDYIFRGEEIKELKLPSKRVKSLAAEYMKDLGVFSEHFPKLIRETGHRLPEFGVECGKLATPQFDDVIFTNIKSRNKDINGIFIGSYLAGIRNVDIERWETHLQRLLHNKDLRDIAVDCIWRSGFTESLLRDMLVLLKEKELTSRAFNRFSFKEDHENISDELFQEIIKTLLEQGDDSSTNVCIQLIESYYFDKKSDGELPEELIFEALSAPPSKGHDQMYGFYWDRIAKGFIKKFPHRSTDLLSSILSNMGRIFRYGDMSYIAKVADKIIISNPKESWKIISKALDIEEKKRYEIVYWLGDSGFHDKPVKGAISHIPAEDIINWIKEDIKKRLWIIRDVLPKTLEQGADGELTRSFIEEFCDDDEIACSLFVHFHMGAWSGPESEYLSGIRDSARKWLSEPSSIKIQSWLGKFIDYLSNRIEEAKIQEEREF